MKVLLTFFLFPANFTVIMSYSLVMSFILTSKKFCEGSFGDIHTDMSFKDADFQT